MSLVVERFTPFEWAAYSEGAHFACFGEIKAARLDRIDFALIVGDGPVPMGYITCREIDAETVYWQFGGAFQGTRNSIGAWRGYQAFVDHCKDKYKRITTLIENDNAAMLKMAAKVGFKIIGIRNYKGVLLEHVLELA